MEVMCESAPEECPYTLLIATDEGIEFCADVLDAELLEEHAEDNEGHEVGVLGQVAQGAATGPGPPALRHPPGSRGQGVGAAGGRGGAPASGST